MRKDTDADENFRLAERLMVEDLLLDEVREDPQFQAELAALAIPSGTLDQALRTPRTIDAWEEAGKDPMLAAIEESLSPEALERLVKAVRGVLELLDYWNQNFAYRLCDVGIESIATAAGWTPGLVEEDEAEDQGPLTDTSRAEVPSGHSPGLMFPARSRVHRFQFRFPQTYTYDEADKLIREFTGMVSAKLWAETGLREKKPNRESLSRAVRCFYLLRVGEYSVRKTAIEVFGNPTRRTEVKQAERRVAAILDIEAPNEVETDLEDPAE